MVVRRIHWGPTSSPILIIGEAPGKSIIGREHMSLVRPDLSDWAGMSLLRWTRTVARTNILSKFPGRAHSGGDNFPMAEAKRGAGRLMRACSHFDLVILLGRRVEAAMGLQKAPWFLPRSIYGTTVRVSPHPSGVNRWWNDEKNRMKGISFWASIGMILRGMKPAWDGDRFILMTSPRGKQGTIKRLSWHGHPSDRWLKADVVWSWGARGQVSCPPQEFQTF